MGVHLGLLTSPPSAVIAIIVASVSDSINVDAVLSSDAVHGASSDMINMLDTAIFDAPMSETYLNVEQARAGEAAGIGSAEPNTLHRNGAVDVLPLGVRSG